MYGRESLLRGIASLFGARREQVRDWDGLIEAIRGGAAFLAQGAAYSYIRARTGSLGPRLFQDHDFGAALEACKWEAFGVAAQDLILMLETELRPLMPEARAGLPAILAGLYAEVLAREPLPPHRAGAGWDDLQAEFAARAVFAAAAPPKCPADISIATARRLMDHAPVDGAIRQSDAAMVTNNVAFRFTDFQRRMRREFDFPRLARAMQARMATAG